MQSVLLSTTTPNLPRVLWLSLATNQRSRFVNAFDRELVNRNSPRPEPPTQKALCLTSLPNSDERTRLPERSSKVMFQIPVC